jgi:hypothetical protein
MLLVELKDKMAEERDELVESPMIAAQPGGGTEGRGSRNVGIRTHRL